MQPILGSKKMENGVVVFFLEGNDRKWDSFNYQELIDMKINAMDLIDNPSSYQVDTRAHKLIMKK
jgi:hypothetical protein